MSKNKQRQEQEQAFSNDKAPLMTAERHQEATYQVPGLTLAGASPVTPVEEIKVNETIGPTLKAKTDRASIGQALRLLCGVGSISPRLEPALTAIVTDLTTGQCDAALKQRLALVAEVCHDPKVKQALEVLG